jgi:uncharacterized protein YqjF (DUF2071 family)
MNLCTKNFTSAECDAARRRLLSTRGDPFLFASWERVVFLHFAIAPEALRPYVPAPLELDLYEDKAYLTIVAVTMRHFQPARSFSLASGLRLMSCQRFLNLRTYVHHGEEPGALFLWGWLSKSLPFPLPTFTLPCAFAELQYQHNHEAGELRGNVKARSSQFRYRATMPACSNFDSPAPGSLAEFALERYTGFFCHNHHIKVFRAWHPTWLQSSIDVNIEENRLLIAKFPWFKHAKFVSANFAPGFNQVSLGRVHSLTNAGHKESRPRHGASAFYEMP